MKIGRRAALFKEISNSRSGTGKGLVNSKSFYPQKTRRFSKMNGDISGGHSNQLSLAKLQYQKKIYHIIQQCYNVLKNKYNKKGKGI